MQTQQLIEKPVQETNPVSKSKRLVALDLARFIAMLMMMQGHVIYALSAPQAINKASIGWLIWDFCRGITAPLFLMVSGASNVFANKRDENGKLSGKTYVKRIRMALILLFIGYLLVFPAGRIYDLPFVQNDVWRTFFQVNVLHLFGITLLGLALLFYFTKNDKQLGYAALFIALSITFLNPLVHKIPWFDILPQPIAMYLSMEQGSIFPIFPFGAFLYFGVFLGTRLKAMSSENQLSFLLKQSWIYGLAVIAVGVPLFYWFHTNNDYAFVDIFRANPGLVLIRLGIVMMIFSGASLINKLTPSLSGVYSVFGKRALIIYVGHLVMIYGTPVFPGFEFFFKNALPFWECIGVVGIVCTSTLALTYIYDYSVNKFSMARDFYKYSIAAYLIFMLFI